MTTRGCHDCEEPAASIRTDRTTAAGLVVRLVRGAPVHGHRPQPRRAAPPTRLRRALLVVPARLPRRPRLRHTRGQQRPPLKSVPHPGRDPFSGGGPFTGLTGSAASASSAESTEMAEIAEMADSAETARASRDVPPRPGPPPSHGPLSLLAQPPQRRPRLRLLTPRHLVRRPGTLVQMTPRGPRHRLSRASGPALRQRPASGPRHPSHPSLAPRSPSPRSPARLPRATTRLPASPTVPEATVPTAGAHASGRGAPAHWWGAGGAQGGRIDGGVCGGRPRHFP